MWSACQFRKIVGNSDPILQSLERAIDEAVAAGYSHLNDG